MIWNSYFSEKSYIPAVSVRFSEKIQWKRWRYIYLVFNIELGSLLEKWRGGEIPMNAVDWKSGVVFFGDTCVGNSSCHMRRVWYRTIWISSWIKTRFPVAYSYEIFSSYVYINVSDVSARIPINWFAQLIMWLYCMQRQEGE